MGLQIVPLAALLIAADLMSGDRRPVPIRVEFVAPADCSDINAFYAAVLSRSTHARRASPGDDEMRLVVKLKKKAGRVHGELRLPDDQGKKRTRRVEGDECDEVVDVLSLTAALAIEKHAPASSQEPRIKAPRAAPAAEPPSRLSQEASSIVPAIGSGPPALSVPLTQSPPESPVRQGRTLTLKLNVSTIGSRIVEPSVDLGGAISARFAWLHSDGDGPSLSVAAIYLSNELIRTAPALGTALAGGSITGCPGWSARSTIVIEPCLSMLGGRLTAGGRGVTAPATVSRAWWSVGALTRTSITLGRGISVELEAGFQIPLARRTFMTTTPERTVGQTPSISAMAGIGLSRTM